MNRNEDTSKKSKNKRTHERINIEPPKHPPPALSMKGMGEIHPDLPQVPFFVGVNGPRKRGKSVLLYNLLQKKFGMYGKAFKENNIILYSPTNGLDGTFDDLKLKNKYGPDTCTVERLISDVYAQQEKYMETGNMTGVLMLFEDITKVRGAWPFIEDMGYTSRHRHIHVFYIAHKLSSVLRGVRTATQQWIIFKPHEQSETEWIMEMFSRKSTRHIWEAALLRAWSIKFNFAYIDYEEEEFDRIYRSGFHDPLFTPEEQAQLDPTYKISPFKDPDHEEPQKLKRQKKNQKQEENKNHYT